MFKANDGETFDLPLFEYDPRFSSSKHRIDPVQRGALSSEYLGQASHFGEP